jgi:DNA-binding NtrC family response regulator
MPGGRSDRVSALAPAVIVFEKSPKWESELKRRMGGRQLLVRPCRSGADVVNLCRQTPGSVVVIDLSSVAAEGWRLLEGLAQSQFRVFPVAISGRDTAEMEWLARELGAVDFVFDTIGGGVLADICRRVLSGPDIRHDAHQPDAQAWDERLQTFN